jgi:hypothetical protein
MLNVLILLYLSFFDVLAHEYLESKSHLEIAEKINHLQTKYLSSEILIVYDIDNTILRANQSLGSDQWFEWNSQLIKNEDSLRNFQTFEELLDFQIKLFSLSRMSLTEIEVRDLIHNLDQNNLPVLYLTSRSPQMRNLTESAFAANKIHFPKNKLLESLPESWILNDRLVSYQNSIFMTSGLNKGQALKFLLNLSKKQFKAIIFVDDHERHTKRVFEIFSLNETPEIITYRYGHEDHKVADFKMMDKKIIMNQEQEILSLIQKMFD